MATIAAADVVIDGRDALGLKWSWCAAATHRAARLRARQRGRLPHTSQALGRASVGLLALAHRLPLTLPSLPGLHAGTR